VKLEYVTIQKRGVIGIVRFDRKTNLNAFNDANSLAIVTP